MPNTKALKETTPQTTEENKVIPKSKQPVEPTKKELKIFKVGNSALYRVAFEGGGVTPKVLEGMWTAPHLAQRAIENYKNG